MVSVHTFDAEASWEAEADFFEGCAEVAVCALPSIVCYIIVLHNHVIIHSQHNMQLTDKSTKLSLCLKLFEQLKMYSVLSRKFTKIMQHTWIVNTCLTHWNAFMKSKYSIQTLFNSFSLLHSCITTLPPSEPGLSSLADRSLSISPDSEPFGSTCSTS